MSCIFLALTDVVITIVYCSEFYWLVASLLVTSGVIILLRFLKGR